MKKRNLLFMSLGIVLLIAVGVTVYMTTRPPAETAETLSRGTTYENAKSMAITAKCLVADKALTISDGDRNLVEQRAMSHLYNVPAGTSVDILIASYSKDQVTGSDRYPSKYGSYNFTMNKQANGDWRFTKFERCQ